MCLNHNKSSCCDHYSFFVQFVCVVILGIVLGIVLSALGLAGYYFGRGRRCGGTRVRGSEGPENYTLPGTDGCTGPCLHSIRAARAQWWIQNHIKTI